MRFLTAMFLIGLLACAGMVGAQDATSVPCGDIQSVYPMSGWKLEDGVCLLRESVSIEGHAAYPQEVAEKSLFARAVMIEYITQEQYKFWKLMQDAVVRPDDPLHDIALNSYEIKYEVFWHSDTVVSVMFLRLAFSGGGRGNPTYQAFTFDLKANRLLSLEDLFLEGVDPYVTIAPLVVKSLTGGMPPDDHIVRATVPIPENYALWALTDSSLLIYFYGPDIYGIMAFTSAVAEIPLDSLKDVLKPEFRPKP